MVPASVAASVLPAGVAVAVAPPSVGSEPVSVAAGVSAPSVSAGSSVFTAPVASGVAVSPAVCVAVVSGEGTLMNIPVQPDSASRHAIMTANNAVVSLVFDFIFSLFRKCTVLTGHRIDQNRIG